MHLHPGNHAGYYPGAETDPPQGALRARTAGCSARRPSGSDGVDKRIDVLATALRAGMDVDDLAELELAYAPPFGSAKDPVNMAGFMAQNVLDGTLRTWSPDDLDAVLDGSALAARRPQPHGVRAGPRPGAL